MNCGFSNLDTLKKHLLAGTMKADVRFNDVISALGLGTVGLFEQTTNRKYQRTVGDQAIYPADRAEFILPRYPIESIATVELKLSETDGWVLQPTAIRTIDSQSGIVNCGDRDLGPYYGQVRFTYTGGFWWETLEPDDAAYPSALPIGANPVPNELYQAWLLQCRYMWKRLDKMGVDLLKDAETVAMRAGGFVEDFAPTVEKTLGNFTRYTLV